MLETKIYDPFVLGLYFKRTSAAPLHCATSALMMVVGAEWVGVVTL